MNGTIGKVRLWISIEDWINVDVLILISVLNIMATEDIDIWRS